ncbi:MAG: spore coat protein CotJB [Firmicutes bacterium]|nr:spore coat protein CotJB [Bacillota bacterium]MDD7601274.1 spore coat protein CotJB [Bacillota bacterium]MDY5856454.1 spore coat protein CotJB [Anaerovoracaceae bacterium]
MTREEALRRVQEADFVLDDVALFLDTHPSCQAALRFFMEYQKEYTEAMAAFESQFGPLTAEDVDTTQGWTWVQGPWPWEMEE